MRKRFFWIAAGACALLALTTTVALAAPLGQDQPVTADELWITLAPLLAIATSTERILEVIWERWEKKEVWPNRDGVADTHAPDYVEKKRLRSHWLGTFVALVAIGLTNVRLFHLLGFDVLFSAPSMQIFDLGIGGIFDDFTWGSLIDWLLTAGIIGWGGTELTHSLIEGLVKSRNLWKEMKEVQSGERSLLDVQLFNQVIAPQLEAMGLTVTQLRQAFTALAAAGVSVDELVGSLTEGKAEEFLQQHGEAGQAMLTLLQGTPEQRGPEPVQLGIILEKITPNIRREILGA